jgi:hypothetical protein
LKKILFQKHYRLHDIANDPLDVTVQFLLVVKAGVGSAATAATNRPIVNSSNTQFLFRLSDFGKVLLH